MLEFGMLKEFFKMAFLDDWIARTTQTVFFPMGRARNRRSTVPLRTTFRQLQAEQRIFLGCIATVRITWLFRPSVRR
jgi:hypothetical protein